MPKLKIISALLAVLFAVAASAQTPADGRVNGRTYVNSYLHIAYTWPATLQSMPLPKPDTAASSVHAYSYPLFIARQGSQPYGIVGVAEKLNVAGPHSTGIKSASDYIDRLEHSLRPGPILSNFSRTKVKGTAGMTFEKFSYLQNGKPSTVFATQIAQYVVVFKCNAQSAPDMAQMEKSVLALREAK
jgi:hypothetical protein